MSVGVVGCILYYKKIQGMLANITCYLPTLLWITTKLSVGMSVGTVRGVGKYHHPMFCTTYSFLFSSRQPNDIFMILQKYIYTLRVGSTTT